MNARTIGIQLPLTFTQFGGGCTDPTFSVLSDAVVL